MHDFEKIDLSTQFHFYDERLEIAHKMGHSWVSESIVKTYRWTRSSTKTGKICGGLSSESILNFLHKIGEPVQRRGGFRPGDIRWKKKRFI